MLLYRYRKKERKTVLFLIFEYSDEVLEWEIDEMLDQSQMKAHDKVQMKICIRRFSQNSVENSVQCLIQCLKMRKKTRKFHSFLIYLLFVFLFISTCFEASQKSENACQRTAR